jgi:hypothetical protein
VMCCVLQMLLCDVLSVADASSVGLVSLYLLMFFHLHNNCSCTYIDQHSFAYSQNRM